MNLTQEVVVKLNNGTEHSQVVTCLPSVMLGG